MSPTDEKPPAYITHEIAAASACCRWCGETHERIAALDLKCLRIEYPRYAGILSHDGFYPSRVRSGRELLTC